MKDRTRARTVAEFNRRGDPTHWFEVLCRECWEGKAPSLRRATMPRRTWSVAAIQHLQIGSARRLRTWSSCSVFFPRSTIRMSVVSACRSGVSSCRSRTASSVGRLMRRGRPFAQKCRHRGNELVGFLNRWHMSTLVETDELRPRNSRRITFSLRYRQQLILLPPHH